MASDGGGITNGQTAAELTTYWRSSDSTGCIVGAGSSVCFGPLNFALANDGTAVFSSNYGCCGTTTWTQVGDSTILINNTPFNPPSVNISAIQGSKSDGVFTGNAAGYFNIVFTLQGGSVPNACAHSVIGPSGGGCVQQ